MNNLKRISVLLDYLHKNENAVYKLIFEANELLAYYETDFESDNGLNEDEVGYEEFQSIVFKKVNDATLFEITYHNLPLSVICGKEKVI